jgi:hypothetical protein
VIQLYIFVEGQTEEAFVKYVLEPHLQPKGVYAEPIIVESSRTKSGVKHKGGGHWRTWRPQISNLLRDQKARPNVRVSTLFDLYGLPDDFPALDAPGPIVDTTRRAEGLETAMAAVFSDRRFVPYLQRHEFEALVLACLDDLHELLVEDDERAGVETLKRELQGTAPEDVNDGRNTAPSKRLVACIPGYEKSLHGPLAVEAMAERLGLDALRARCPRFSTWVGRLEQLGVSILGQP